jgi:hypothetical protein
MASFPIQEQGILGVKDNGTPEGVVKVRLDQANLIKLPANSFIQSNEFQAVLLGSASSNNSFNAFNNGDGSNSAFNISVGSGLGANLALTTFAIYGKVIGVRFRRIPSSTPFSVVIDGVPYDCPDYIVNPRVGNTTNIGQDREAQWIVADNLSDGQHTVQVFVYPSALISKTLVFYGFVVERRIGYTEFEKISALYSKGTLTAAVVNVPTSDEGGQSIRSVKSIIYQNTDTVARNVTINHGAILIAKIYLAAAGTQGDTVNFDFGVGVGFGSITSTQLQHFADLTGKVKFVTIGK